MTAKKTTTIKVRPITPEEEQLIETVRYMHRYCPFDNAEPRIRLSPHSAAGDFHHFICVDCGYNWWHLLYK